MENYHTEILSTIRFKKKIAATTDLLDRQVELVVLGAVFKLMGSTVPASTNDSKDQRQLVQPGQEARDSNWFLWRIS